MNIFYLSLFLSLSGVLPAIAGISRFRLTDGTFQPFIVLVWLGLLTDVLNLLFAYIFKTTALNSNIYVLLEYLIIVYQFKRWNDAGGRACSIMVAAGIVTWILDNLAVHTIFTRNSLFRIFSAFTIIFLSINEINKLIVYERRPILKNPVFLTCFTFLLYYSYKAFAEIFIAFDLDLSHSFNQHVFMVLPAANFISNILYTIAILCIPPRQEFTLPY